MAKSNMNQDILKVLLSEEQLHQRIQEMGDELFEKFRDKDPMFVGVLNGCFVFMADLVRAAQLKSEVEFISVSSYKNATKSSGVVEITRDLQRDITGRDIIVVEDILDSGNTLYFLRNYGVLLAVSVVCCTPLIEKLWNLLRRRTLTRVATILVLLVVSTAYVVGSTNSPFLYFNF